MCRRSPKLSFTDWTLYLDEIAATKKLEGGKMKEKLAACGAPGTTGATVGQGQGRSYWGEGTLEAVKLDGLDPLVADPTLV